MLFFSSRGWMWKSTFKSLKLGWLWKILKFCSRELLELLWIFRIFFVDESSHLGVVFHPKQISMCSYPFCEWPTFIYAHKQNLRNDLNLTFKKARTILWGGNAINFFLFFLPRVSCQVEQQQKKKENRSFSFYWWCKF